MAEQDRRRLRVGDKFAEELHTVVSFLDPHLVARARTAGKPWSWRKTFAFILITGLIGWVAILGLVYWIYTLL